MANYRIVASRDPFTLVPAPATGPCEIEIITAQGPYHVFVSTLSQAAVLAPEIDSDGFNTGRDVVTGYRNLTWDETCENVADQVIASLGAP